MGPILWIPTIFSKHQKMDPLTEDSFTARK